MNRLLLRHAASSMRAMCANNSSNVTSRYLVRPIVVRTFATPSTSSSSSTPTPSPPLAAPPAADDAIHEAVVSNVLHASTSPQSQPQSSVHLASSPPTDTAFTTDASVASDAAVAEVAKFPDGPLTVFAKFFRGKSSSSANVVDSASTTTADVLTSTADAATSTVTAAAQAAPVKASLSDLLLTPAMSILNGVHDLTGLPWWLSIVIATVSIRAALLPVTLMTMKNSAVMAAVKDDIAERRQAVVEAARSGDRVLANTRQTEMQAFMRNAGIAPLRVLVGPLVQFPVFISFFVAIRRLAANDPSLATGGLAWFSDLSVMDPTYVLPVVCGASLFAMTELGGDTGSTTMPANMKLGMRVIAGLSVPLTYWFPAAVFCYWIPNNVFSVSLGTAMRLPSVKSALGLRIDPATIPGTKASKLLAAKAASRSVSASRGVVVDAANAAASYSKWGRSQTAAEQMVKPVLFKTRPSKKAKAKSNT